MALSNLDLHLVAATLLFVAVRFPASVQTPISTPKLYNTTAGLEITYEQVTPATPERHIDTRMCNPTYTDDPLVATLANSTSKQSDKPPHCPGTLSLNEVPPLGKFPC